MKPFLKLSKINLFLNLASSEVSANSLMCLCVSSHVRTVSQSPVVTNKEKIIIWWPSIVSVAHCQTEHLEVCSLELQTAKKYYSYSYYSYHILAARTDEPSLRLTSTTSPPWFCLPGCQWTLCSTLPCDLAPAAIVNLGRVYTRLLKVSWLA